MKRAALEPDGSLHSAGLIFLYQAWSVHIPSVSFEAFVRAL